MTTIRYFIPEDGDVELQPNVFLAPKSRHPGAPPTLGQIRDAFPLPGRYYFRFKSPLMPGADREKGAMAVWMDCTQENVPVPTWRNSIVAKVTRVGVDDDEDDDDSDFVSGGAAHHVHHHTPAPAPPPRPAPVPQPTQPPAATAHHFDVFGESSAASTGSVASDRQNKSAPSTGNLLDAMHSVSPPSVTASSSGGGLFDMDFGGGTTSTSNNVHNDFLGMTAPPVMSNQPQQGGFNPAQPFGGMPQQRQQQQQQSQQQQQRPPQQQNVFNSFSDQQGPFGGLGTPWK